MADALVGAAAMAALAGMAVLAVRCLAPRTRGIVARSYIAGEVRLYGDLPAEPPRGVMLGDEWDVRGPVDGRWYRSTWDGEQWVARP